MRTEFHTWMKKNRLTQVKAAAKLEVSLGVIQRAIKGQGISYLTAMHLSRQTGLRLKSLLGVKS